MSNAEFCKILIIIFEKNLCEADSHKTAKRYKINFVYSCRDSAELKQVWPALATPRIRIIRVIRS